MREVPFGVWLGRQQDRNDPVGDLARDYIASGIYPAALKDLKRHMAAQGASPQAWSAFDRAVGEWTDL